MVSGSLALTTTRNMRHRSRQQSCHDLCSFLRGGALGARPGATSLRWRCGQTAPSTRVRSGRAAACPAGAGRNAAGINPAFASGVRFAMLRSRQSRPPWSAPPRMRDCARQSGRALNLAQPVALTFAARREGPRALCRQGGIGRRLGAQVEAEQAGESAASLEVEGGLVGDGGIR